MEITTISCSFYNFFCKTLEHLCFCGANSYNTRDFYNKRCCKYGFFICFLKWDANRSFLLSDRIKSKSSPQLDEEEKPQRRGSFSWFTKFSICLVLLLFDSLKIVLLITPCPNAVAHTCGLNTGGMAQWLLEEQLRSTRDVQARSQKAASELEMERRNILNAMRYREPERGGRTSPLHLIWIPVNLLNQSIMTYYQSKFTAVWLRADW